MYLHCLNWIHILTISQVWLRKKISYCLKVSICLSWLHMLHIYLAVFTPFRELIYFESRILFFLLNCLAKITYTNFHKLMENCLFQWVLFSKEYFLVSLIIWVFRDRRPHTNTRTLSPISSHTTLTQLSKPLIKL